MSLVKSRAPGARSTGILGSGGWSFLVATAGVNGCNFLFHVVVSRLLGPSHYGALGALLNILTVLAVPLGALQLAVTQAVVKEQAGGSSLRRLLVRSTVWGVATAIAFVALAPIIGSFLHLTSLTSLVLLGTWIPVAVAASVLQGALLGELRYVPVALAVFLGGGAARLALGSALAVAGLGLTGAVAATVGGQVLTTLWLVVVARHRLGARARLHRHVRLHARGRADRRNRVVLRVAVRDALLSVAALSGYTALTGIDSFLARHFLRPDAAGQYAAGATAGHIAMFLPGALVMVAFPRLAAEEEQGRATGATFARALSLTVVLGLTAGAALAAAPRLVVRTLFGAHYLAAASIIGVLGLTSALLGVVGVFVYRHLARRSAAALVPWVGVAAVPLLQAILHGGMRTLATCMAAVTAGVLAASALLALRPSRARGAPMGVGSGELAAISLPVAAAPSAAVPAWRAGGAAVTGTSSRGGVDVSLVVPFYNPGDRLAALVGDLVATLSSTGMRFEVIAVSDGSTDGSPSSVANLDARVQVVELGANQGKGAALRIGMRASHGRYVGFIDGDGDIPACQVAALVAVVESYEPDVVLGSKRHPMSEVVYPPLRRLMSFTYQVLVHVLFHVRAKDTQTGLKLVRRDVLAAVLPRMVEKRFAFDLELLVVAHRLGYRRVFEAPVWISERFSSTIRPRSVLDLLLDTAAIFYRVHVLHYYDRWARTGEGSEVGASLVNDGLRGPTDGLNMPVGASVGG